MPLVLLDTQALLWSQISPDRLGRLARSLIARAHSDKTLRVSAVSFWEVGRLVAERRIRLSPEPRAWRVQVLALGFEELVLDGATAIRAAEIMPEHGDPFDRLILAAAITSGARLVTSDQRLLEWPGALSRQDARR